MTQSKPAPEPKTFWQWLKSVMTPIADQTEVYQTGWDEHPTLTRKRAGSITFGGGGIGMNRVTRPAGSLVLKTYDYWCSCGTQLTDGPRGGDSVNAVCETCKLNYGCLPGYWGS